MNYSKQLLRAALFASTIALILPSISHAKEIGGHGVGNRTLIVDKFAAKYLLVDGVQAATRTGKTDFANRDELVKYSTPNGSYIISYKHRYPVGRFEPARQQ